MRVVNFYKKHEVVPREMDRAYQLKQVYRRWKGLDPQRPRRTLWIWGPEKTDVHKIWLAEMWLGKDYWRSNSKGELFDTYKGEKNVLIDLNGSEVTCDGNYIAFIMEHNSIAVCFGPLRGENAYMEDIVVICRLSPTEYGRKYARKGSNPESVAKRVEEHTQEIVEITEDNQYVWTSGTSIYRNQKMGLPRTYRGNLLNINIKYSNQRREGRKEVAWIWKSHERNLLQFAEEWLGMLDYWTNKEDSSPGEWKDYNGQTNVIIDLRKTRFVNDSELSKLLTRCKYHYTVNDDGRCELFQGWKIAIIANVDPGTFIMDCNENISVTELRQRTKKLLTLIDSIYNEDNADEIIIP